MSVVAAVLKQVPAAAKFKVKLTALEDEVVALRAENARLKDELAQYLEQWETLDSPQLAVLQYLAQHEHGHAAAIAKDAAMNMQIADTSLIFLAQHQFVAPKASGKAARGIKVQYTLAAKGIRYLRERGFLK